MTQSTNTTTKGSDRQHTDSQHPLLTVFTCTYNRAHTLGRVYESLCRQTCRDFCWLVIDDGSTDGTRALVEGWMAEGKIDIKYIYKSNGGLHTGYNTAYANIDTELNVCIDSDDWMPDDAVQIIRDTWASRGSGDVAGIVGLDYDSRSGAPLGGPFPEGMEQTHRLDLYIRNIHRADHKVVHRSDLTRRFAPMTGFDGERFFNPNYIAMQIDDLLPCIVVNRNLCWVEYQDSDSMSRAIFRQYVDSPRSFSKTRVLEMTHSRTTLLNNCRLAVHYVATSLLASDKSFISRSPRKLLTLAAVPLGICLYFYIKYRASRQ